MAHNLQNRYSKLVDAKLRATLVTRDNVIFNTRYEGEPTAGAVMIPVRDAEVAVNDYSPTNGVSLTHGSTTYLKILVNKDRAVNELIDGYQAEAVPDNIVADRLDSAGYSTAQDLDTHGLTKLVAAETAISDADSPINGQAATVLSFDGSNSDKTLSATNIYKAFVDARSAMNKKHVPKTGRWVIVNSDVEAFILLDKDNFIKKGDLSQQLVETGAIATIAGFAVYTSDSIPNGLNYTVSSVNYYGVIGAIFGHPDYCTRVDEYKVPIAVNDLKQSGTYIGACAVQGRMVYAHSVNKPQAFVLLKYKGTAVA